MEGRDAVSGTASGGEDAADAAARAGGGAGGSGGRAPAARRPFGGGRALVTGAAGFVGRYLVRALLADGWRVTAAALDRPGDIPRDDPLHDADWAVGDLTAQAHVRALVERAAPDLVVPLAAISHVPTAAGDPAAAWRVNVLAAVDLFDALTQAMQRGVAAPRVVVIGSGECYGRLADDGGPIREDAPLAPRTVYAATKAAQETAALQAWRAAGLPVVLARPFNHSGAGQPSRFLLPALAARALALRDAPAGTPLVLGNTTPVRDFLHVSDVVAAYIALGHAGVPGTAYNVASGIGRSVRAVAAAVCARAGVDAPLQEDPALVRPVDVPALVGDPERLMTTTGWRPRHSFDDLLDELLHAATH